MYYLIKRNSFIENKIFNMNKAITQTAIDNALNIANYRMLFKGIWTGVLISLIFHHFFSH